MLRGASISVMGNRGSKSRSSPIKKSWQELETFFTRERRAEGRDYKKDIQREIQEYRGWVYSAVDCISDRVGAVEFGFYRIDSGEKLIPASIEYNAITKPIIYPNDYMTFEFIKQWCQVQLDLCGKAAILKRRNKLGMPWELWPLDMNYFERIVFQGGKKGILSPPVSYEFRVDDATMNFPAKDIIWLHYPHPESLWDGFSPIQAAAYVTDIDYYLEVYERSFFQNSARVDFVLEVEDNIDAHEARRLQEQWISKYGGSKKAYYPAVIGGGAKVVPIQNTNKDFQFIELAGWTKDRILSTYRVPEGKLGLFEDINRANQKGIDIAFNEEAIAPRIKLWDREITKQLIYEFTPLVKMIHDNPIPRDREMDLKELEMRGGGVAFNSPNELRNWWDGAKPVEGGDIVLVDNKLIPITMVGELETEEPGPAGNEPDKPGKDDDTPDYDTEHDPGGDESDKSMNVILSEVDWSALLIIENEYKTLLEHTSGWSMKKAYDFAMSNCYHGTGYLKEYICDCVKRDVPVEEFRKGAIKLILKKLGGINV